HRSRRELALPTSERIPGQRPAWPLPTSTLEVPEDPAVCRGRTRGCNTRGGDHTSLNKNQCPSYLDGSWTSRTWLVRTVRNTWTTPLGQRISMRSILSSLPVPKWTPPELEEA